MNCELGIKQVTLKNTFTCNDEVNDRQRNKILPLKAHTAIMLLELINKSEINNYFSVTSVLITSCWEGSPSATNQASSESVE